MKASDFLDPVALAEELAQELEVTHARMSDADHRPMAFTGATIKRSTTVNHAIAAHLAVRVARKFSELEARIAAAEHRRGLHYRGTWRGDVEHGRDDVVTHAGSLWICQRQGTRSKPGGDSDAWKLASKKDLQQ